MAEAKLQALWTLDVRPLEDWLPCGVILFHTRRVFGDFYEEGRIFGGDQHHTYSGSYRVENFQVSGTIDVHRYSPTDSQPFGPAERQQVVFSQRLDGSFDRRVIEVGGTRADGSLLTLRLTWRESLA